MLAEQGQAPRGAVSAPIACPTGITNPGAAEATEPGRQSDHSQPHVQDRRGQDGRPC